MLNQLRGHGDARRRQSAEVLRRPHGLVVSKCRERVVELRPVTLEELKLSENYGAICSG